MVSVTGVGGAAAGGSATAVASADGADGAPTEEPQPKQNFASAGSSVPHSAHTFACGVPQDIQNFAPAGLSFLQLLQIT